MKFVMPTWNKEKESKANRKILSIPQTCLQRFCHVRRHHETDRSPVISSRRSSNVSRIRWRNWTLYIIIEFIMQIQPSDGSKYYNRMINVLQETGSKCFNRLIRALILEGFYIEVLVPPEGLSSGVSQRRLFCYFFRFLFFFFFFFYCFDRCGMQRQAYPITVSKRVVFSSVWQF